jgi:glycosyltransferase involved in cell wall biosynthesis
VVAFDTGGLPDIVEHRHTGYLAKSFEPEDLARGIAWVLGDSARLSGLSENARERATRLWNYQSVARQYVEVYRKAATGTSA